MELPLNEYFSVYKYKEFVFIKTTLSGFFPHNVDIVKQAIVENINKSAGEINPVAILDIKSVTKCDENSLRIIIQFAINRAKRFRKKFTLIGANTNINDILKNEIFYKDLVKIKNNVQTYKAITYYLDNCKN